MMWPWEHLLVAYGLYSLTTNVLLRRSPSAGETIAVVVASQLPDLVDKPLAWTYGVTETGYAIGHSAFVAPLACLATLVAADRYGDRVLAGAFSLAYGSHLVTDVFNPMRSGRPPEPRVLLWPLASPPTGDHGGLFDHFVVYFVRYANQPLAGGLSAAVALQLAAGFSIVALWLVDGAPVVSDCLRFVRDRLR
ncbi:LexA-binding, inner membrane-associated putative hydrolase [Halobiforma haloterrestris]|uniref:LexA-binding, inner membrane-associated putative hydrolase n=1 Tax=Natronobacterium haloterrestre TaxID=148448 RepID=A0A1I1H6R6_NATHA|nr:metal-dependent hydrolase [Halobiforma haloterrestris]SFC19456.1 LexA-binding, inner membrane-associated putative hydrolase [Halobiforma haloterrestris]